MIRSQISRRRALTGGLAAVTAAALPMPAIAQGPRKVTFLCSWQPEGGNFFAWIAQQRGFWKERGLDVEVLRGSGAALALQSVGGNPDRFHFGMSPLSTACLQVARGLPVVGIGMVNYDSQMGVAVAGSGPIKDAKDLAGKSWGCAVNSGEVPFLPLFAEKAGFDFNSVKVQQVAANVRDTLLLRRQVDAVSGAASTVIGNLAAQNFDPRFFLFRSVGLDFYGQSLITQAARLKQDPGLCKAFVDGAMEGLKYTITNPEDTLGQMVKLHGDIAATPSGQKVFATSFGIVTALNLSKPYFADGLGNLNMGILQSANALVLAAANAGGTVSAEQLFSPQFVGSQSVTEKQIATARNWAAPYAKALI